MNQHDLDQVQREASLHAARVRNLAVEVLSGQEISQAEHARIASLAQAVRMLRTFEAVTVHVEAELCDGAGAVLRSLLEQHFVFTAVRSDPESLRRLAAEDQSEKHKAMAGLLKLDAELLTAELTKDRILEEQAKLQKGSGFNAFDWAERAGDTSAYITLYRKLSTYAHGAASGLDQYIQMDREGTVLGIRSRVATEEGIDFVLTGARIMLRAVPEFLTDKNQAVLSAKLSELQTAADHLYARYSKLVEDLLRQRCSP